MDIEQVKLTVMYFSFVIALLAYIIGKSAEHKKLKRDYEDTRNRFEFYQDQFAMEALKVLFDGGGKSAHYPRTVEGMDGVLKLARLRFHTWRKEYEAKHPARVHEKKSTD